MFGQLMFIFNSNLGVDFGGQLLLIYMVKFENFGLWNALIVSFLFICELLDLDIIWLVNLMILTEILILGIFCLKILEKSL